MIKKIFSGVQPTGNLHLGNYLGAIKNFVKLQNEKENECIFCVVDLHAITVKQDPKELKKNIRETAATFIASGIDPNKSISLQKHKCRHELWFISEGTATVEQGTDAKMLSKRTYELHEQLIVPLESWHRLSNETELPVKIIEIQYGDKCIEEDIKRYYKI